MAKEKEKNPVETAFECMLWLTVIIVVLIFIHG